MLAMMVLMMIILVIGYREILEIVKLEEDTVTIKKHEKSGLNYTTLEEDENAVIINIEYNQEISIPSNWIVYDSINYWYIIEITKK